ncbi:hypothetical protein TcasGA2_TC008327 [Tribolium castaneum]|uniref:Uncharacterized protein n=1 Tax=Tribolium castaneum TaxID=7070 RepID=D2A145_TRICA|nr:hypothetical protein TcasGA2_TC008327 [Tribolium castaneum]
MDTFLSTANVSDDELDTGLHGPLLLLLPPLQLIYKRITKDQLKLNSGKLRHVTAALVPDN